MKTANTLEDACHMAGIDMTPNAVGQIEAVADSLRPIWTGGEQDFLMEVVFAIASLPYTAKLLETSKLKRRIQSQDAQKLASEFQEAVPQLKLSEKEKVWLIVKWLNHDQQPNQPSERG